MTNKTLYQNMILEKIGHAVNYAIKERGINRHKLCELADISTASLYKVLNGKNYEIAVLVALARVLQIHVDFNLLTDDDLHFDTEMKKHYKNKSKM